jgi:cytochrome c556
MSKASMTTAFAAFAAAAGLVACGQPSTTKTAAETALPPPTPPFSVNEMMVMIVDQPGELLWDVEKAGHAPKTDEDWYNLENHAVSLASAATLIQLGGTGPADAGWARQPTWRSSAQQLVAAAMAARTAAHAKDMAGLTTANGQIVEACEGCHKEFKPDIPTGKLFLHHRPGTN